MEGAIQKQSMEAMIDLEQDDYLDLGGRLDMSRPIADIGCNFPLLKEAPIRKDPHLGDQLFPENSL